MKIIVLTLMSALLFSGCAHSAWESVCDIQTSVSAVTAPDTSYKQSVSLPDEITLVESKNDWNVYAMDNGAFEIETRKFLASSPDSAFKVLSGFSEENLNALRIQTGDLTEYRFVWVTNSEQGSRIHTADLMMDGMECYSVVCSVNAEESINYQDEIQQVISSYTLVSDELV